MSAILQLGILLSWMHGIYAIDCLMVEAKGWYDPDNVYKCPANTKCCMEAGAPTCCKDKAITDSVYDQVKLWGCVIGAAVLVGILVCCCRRDSSCCEGHRNCKYYICCRCCCDKDERDNRPDTSNYEKFSKPKSLPSSTAVSENKLQSVSPVFVGGHLDQHK